MEGLGTTGRPRSARLSVACPSSSYPPSSSALPGSQPTTIPQRLGDMLETALQMEKTNTAKYIIPLKCVEETSKSNDTEIPAEGECEDPKASTGTVALPVGSASSNTRL